ncbi:hypothetical protein QF046_000928 [Microbacterium sp. W4I4]|uniref:DUF4350 domain-containing protein n=1 Tax=Microbacterium sp. W4I4 TaxID=3042295 RepID=UPI00277F80EB|nr:DUF4350 domain-containing protein [Microbacterium sp. W4I4]MDQ0613287.1 hypothetical protein [Microbacterium sp. W4I4]
MSIVDAPVSAAVVPDGDSAVPSTAAPHLPGRGRRVLGWVFVIALLLGIGLLSMRFVAASPDLTGTLNPESPGPGGAKALAELVRDQGVDIEVTRSRLSAADALDADATLVLTDPYALTDEAATTLMESADRVVLLTSSARMLRLLDLGEDAPAESGAVDAQCALPEFARVGSIDAERMFMSATGVEGCFREPSGASAVLRADVDGRTITLVEGAHLLANDALAENGNAALGLALLAQQDRVVWYVPTFADSDISSGGGASIADLTPGWISPAILLLLIAAIAAIVWRGRRFGPLVAESLPVTVRAAETMQGRARLTAKAADAPHAAAVIRTGTLTRLAARLALSPRASVPEIADAASDRLRVPRTSLYDLLGGPPPQSDNELIELARRLAELETAVDDAVRTERNRP